MSRSRLKTTQQVSDPDRKTIRSMEASKTVCLSTVIDHLETYDGQVLDYEQIEDLNAVTKAPKEVKDDHSDLNKHKD